MFVIPWAVYIPDCFVAAAQLLTFNYIRRERFGERHTQGSKSRCHKIDHLLRRYPCAFHIARRVVTRIESHRCLHGIRLLEFGMCHRPARAEYLRRAERHIFHARLILFLNVRYTAEPHQFHNPLSVAEQGLQMFFSTAALCLE